MRSDSDTPETKTRLTEREMLRTWKGYLRAPFRPPDSKTDQMSSSESLADVPEEPRGARQLVSYNTLQTALNERDALRDKVQNLRELLATERAKQEGREAGPEEARAQLDQHQLGREDGDTREGLEVLQKYSHPETANKIAAQVREEVRCRKKKVLQKDYEELKVAYITSQIRFEAELREIRQKNQVLQARVSGDPQSEGSGSLSLEPEDPEETRLGEPADGLPRLTAETLRAEAAAARRALVEELRALQSLGREKDMLESQLHSQICLTFELSKILHERQENRPFRAVQREILAALNPPPAEA